MPHHRPLDTGDHIIFVGEVVAKSGAGAMKDGLNERIDPLFRLGGKKFLCSRERIEVDKHGRSKGRV